MYHTPHLVLLWCYYILGWCVCVSLVCVVVCQMVTLWLPVALFVQVIPTDSQKV